MKKEFDLGLSVVPIRGFRRSLSITVEFGGQPYRKPDEGYFSVQGQIRRGKRWVEFGQCQHHIREICHEKWRPLMDEILDLDKKHALKYCKCIPAVDVNRIKRIINGNKY